MQLRNPLIWLRTVIGPYLAPCPPGEKLDCTQGTRKRDGEWVEKETAREVVAWLASPASAQSNEQPQTRKVTRP